MTHHRVAEHLPDDLRECIDRCSTCHEVCVATIVHCFTERGDDTAADHIRALRECAQACELSHDLMLRRSELHRDACRVCAAACQHCAESCEQLDDDVMRRCAEECRRCAESCRAIVGAGAHP
jgi:hypothetical protein